MMFETIYHSEIEDEIGPCKITYTKIIMLGPKSVLPCLNILSDLCILRFQLIDVNYSKIAELGVQSSNSF